MSSLRAQWGATKRKKKQESQQSERDREREKKKKTGRPTQSCEHSRSGGDCLEMVERGCFCKGLCPRRSHELQTLPPYDAARFPALHSVRRGKATPSIKHLCESL